MLKLRHIKFQSLHILRPINITSPLSGMRSTRRCPCHICGNSARRRNCKSKATIAGPICCDCWWRRAGVHLTFQCWSCPIFWWHKAHGKMAKWKLELGCSVYRTGTFFRSWSVSTNQASLFTMGDENWWPYSYCLVMVNSASALNPWPNNNLKNGQVCWIKSNLLPRGTKHPCGRTSDGGSCHWRKPPRNRRCSADCEGRDAGHFFLVGHWSSLLEAQKVYEIIRIHGEVSWNQVLGEIVEYLRNLTKRHMLRSWLSVFGSFWDWTLLIVAHPSHVWDRFGQGMFKHV